MTLLLETGSQVFEFKTRKVIKKWLTPINIKHFLIIIDWQSGIGKMLKVYLHILFTV